MRDNVSVIVIGAGPTGLTAALSLARRGVPVRIIDKNAGPAQASRAMVVHARNLEFYRQLGFAEEVVGAGIRIERLHLFEHGKEAASLAFGDMGAGLSPYPFLLCYPQDDHERLLGGKLRDAGLEVEWDAELTALEQGEDGVTATLRRRGEVESCRAAYLVGADGAHSTVRHALGIGFPGGSYDQLFYVADVTTEAGGAEMVMNLDPRGFVLKLPVRSTGAYRFIGLVPPELSGQDGLGFEDLRPRLHELTGDRVQAVHWFSLYHVHHRVASQFKVGRCFLAGDAGHVHSPVGGQGMNTGIGDAINLGWKLADVVRGRAGPQILDSYEPERIAFARTLVATTDRVFSGVSGQGFGPELVRTILMPHVVPFLTGFAAVRRALFRRVSQVQIAYHDSKLSRGRTGEIEAGERLPWIDDPDTFAPLQSLDWQVHVHGQARGALRDEADKLGLPLHEFEWTQAARAAGYRRDAAYLVRPDGHVGLADADASPGSLRDYAESVGLQRIAA